MPEVSIEELTIKNFGPYYGSHTLNFGNLGKKCGILVGGKNGAGKTHLLRALYLAVVGETGVLDLKKVEPGEDATRFFFDRSLNRKAMAEGQDTVRLEVTLAQRDDQAGAGSRKISLVREIKFRPSGTLWKSKAIRSDNNEPVDDPDVISKLRDAFLPRHLARFFFFDAERSQSFNLGQKDIVDGISRILGLWTYTELEADLRNLIQNKIPRAFDSKAATTAGTRLAQISGQIVTAEATLATNHRQLSKLDLQEREDRAELAEVEDDLLTLGAVDPKKLEMAQARRREISGTKGELETTLRDSWEKDLPMTLLGNYRSELNSYLMSEEKLREWETSKSAVEPKIPQIKRDVFEGVPASYTLHPDFEKFYKMRLEEALKNLFHPTPEGMAAKQFVTDRSDTSAQIRSRLASSSANVKALVDVCVKLNRMEDEARTLDQQIRELSQNTAAIVRGGELHAKRGEITAKLDQIEAQKLELTNAISRIESELAEYRREEKNLVEQVQKGEKGESLSTRAALYREAVHEIRQKAAIQLRKKISQEVGDLWVNITDRSREFNGMEFDDHWNCFLKRVDGTKSSWDENNTSAG